MKTSPVLLWEGVGAGGTGEGTCPFSAPYTPKHRSGGGGGGVSGLVLSIRAAAATDAPAPVVAPSSSKGFVPTVAVVPAGLCEGAVVRAADDDDDWRARPRAPPRRAGRDDLAGRVG
ncbi:hypothetical protein ACHAW5_009197 [Stephanodiscus triporus]|uniref:Uncharacterized protein n=1 Tax=Stephanodiscus triporus TaxID=2934178 RepID=A0ABD3N192_9STRA